MVLLDVPAGVLNGLQEKLTRLEIPFVLAGNSIIATASDQRAKHASVAGDYGMGLRFTRRSCRRNVAVPAELIRAMVVIQKKGGATISVNFAQDDLTCTLMTSGRSESSYICLYLDTT